MNLNARHIVVVHIGFRFFDYVFFTSEDRGSNMEYRNCSFFFTFFPLVSILLNSIEFKLFSFC